MFKCGLFFYIGFEITSPDMENFIQISTIFVLIKTFAECEGMKKMEYKTRQWHEKCFVCCTCKNPIGEEYLLKKNVF